MSIKTTVRKLADPSGRAIYGAYDLRFLEYCHHGFEPHSWQGRASAYCNCCIVLRRWDLQIGRFFIKGFLPNVQIFALSILIPKRD